MNKNKISSILKFGLFLVPVLPLVVTRSLFFPFITGRNFIFRVIIEVLLVFWIWLMMTEHKYTPHFSLIVYSMVGLVSVLFLATIFSISPYKSFWSSFERMEGFWAHFHYFIYFLMLVSVFKEKKDWQSFFGVSLATSAVVSLYALFQFVGKLSIHQGDRLDATMGNATYLAIYLVFHIFILASFFLESKNIWIKIAMGFLGLLQLFILYRTATRGAILGLLAGLIILSIINSIWAKGRAKIFSLILLGAVIATPLLFLAVKNSHFVKSSDVLSRFSSISFNETTTQSRLLIWSMAYKAWQDKPVLGWGPESFVYIFSKYYDARLWRQEPWFDRAHNVFLDWLTATGVVGLLAYLSIFGATVWSLIRFLRAKVLDVKTVSIFHALLMAYLVNNLFVFDNFTSYIIFFAVIAYINWLCTKDKDRNLKTEIETKPVFAANILAGIMAMVVAFTVYSFNIKPALASESIIDSLTYLTYSRDGSRARDLENGLNALKEGLAYNTFGTTEIREQMAQYSQRISGDATVPSDYKHKFSDFALEQIKMQAETFPYDVRAKAFLSTLYGDAGDYPSAILTAQNALTISNQRHEFYFLLGEAYFKAGEKDLAIQAFKKAYNLSPDYPDAIHNYATILIFAGHPKEAEALLKNHFGSEIYPDTRYVNAYAAIRDINKITLVWEKLVEADPNNAQYRLNLASVYIKTFQDQKAIKELEKTIELSPQFKQQGEIYIQQIKSGSIKR